MANSSRHAGFTYLGILFAVVLLGVVQAVAGTVWHSAAMREREQELLFVGKQYRQALKSYFEAAPRGRQEYPQSLDDLVEDRRFPVAIRHLRRRYADPLSDSPEWGLVKVGGRIVGVYSLAEGRPFKAEGFGACCAAFVGAKRYSDWKFTAAAR